eukprot:100024-Amphidinium_carterae.1
MRTAPALTSKRHDLENWIPYELAVTSHIYESTKMVPFCYSVTVPSPVHMKEKHRLERGIRRTPSLSTLHVVTSLAAREWRS